MVSRKGLHPIIGMASGKFVASVAADLASPDKPILIDKKRGREFLSLLLAGLLPISDETKRRLELLGLHTMGQIASLPGNALIAEFGKEGSLAHQLANGIDDCPVRARAKPVSLKEESHEEYALETVDVLMTEVDQKALFLGGKKLESGGSRPEAGRALGKSGDLETDEEEALHTTMSRLGAEVMVVAQ